MQNIFKKVSNIISRIHSKYHSRQRFKQITKHRVGIWSFKWGSKWKSQLSSKIYPSQVPIINPHIAPSENPTKYLYCIPNSQCGLRCYFVLSELKELGLYTHSIGLSWPLSKVGTGLEQKSTCSSPHRLVIW